MEPRCLVCGAPIGKGAPFESDIRMSEVCSDECYEIYMHDEDSESAEQAKADAIYEELKMKVRKSDKQNTLEQQGCIFKGQELLDNHEINPDKECSCGRPLKERKAGI